MAMRMSDSDVERYTQAEFHEGTVIGQLAREVKELRAQSLRTHSIPSDGEVEAARQALQDTDGYTAFGWRATLPGMHAAITAAAKVRANSEGSFKLGDRVTKLKGASWTGRVVGFYSTALTPVGYAVESENEPGSVQIYPEAALSAQEVK